MTKDLAAGAHLNTLSKSQLIDLLLELYEQNAVLVHRVADLERRVGLNSNNSSKPPSSDGLAKPAADKSRTKSLRGKSGRPSGGQPGHKGVTLKQVSNPSEVVDHYPNQCPDCNGTLSPAHAITFATRQVFGLAPPPPLFVTEHRAHSCRCQACGTEVSASFPDWVGAPVQYSDEIAALAAYLQTQHCVPLDRLSRIFGDLYKIRIAPSTLSNMIEKKARQMRDFADKVKDMLADSIVPVKHLDETGFRISGRTRWLHMLCSTALSHLRLGAGRGDIPSPIAGTIVHDCWAPYLAQENVQHSLCNAHLLRELQAVIDHDKEPWATDMQMILCDALKLTQAARKQGKVEVSADDVGQIKRRYDVCCNQAISFHEALPPPKSTPKPKKRGRPKRRVGHNLAERLRTHKPAVLLFLEDLSVPFTNNEAERDLRMTKVRQKVSGGFRTKAGAETYCTLRTAAETARKQGWDVLEAFKESPEMLINRLNPIGQSRLDQAGSNPAPVGT